LGLLSQLLAEPLAPLTRGVSGGPLGVAGGVGVEVLRLGRLQLGLGRQALPDGFELLAEPAVLLLEAPDVLGGAVALLLLVLLLFLAGLGRLALLGLAIVLLGGLGQQLGLRVVLRHGGLLGGFGCGRQILAAAALRKGFGGVGHITLSGARQPGGSRAASG